VLDELRFVPLGLAQAAALIARERLDYATYLERRSRSVFASDSQDSAGDRRLLRDPIAAS
jgi:hypothetical protein